MPDPITHVDLLTPAELAAIVALCEPLNAEGPIVLKRQLVVRLVAAAQYGIDTRDLALMVLTAQRRDLWYTRVLVVALGIVVVLFALTLVRVFGVG